MRKNYRPLIRLFALFLLLAAPQAALAHAFPDHAEPKVGAVTATAPTKVRIWFDCALKPGLSTLSVQDAGGTVVDKGDAQVSAKDGKLLEVSVPQLPPGRYRVIWKAVAKEGHQTSGDYTFAVK